MHSCGEGCGGDHTVIFASDGERLELTHKASSRMTLPPEQFVRLSGSKAGNRVCIPWKTFWGCPNYNFFGIVAVLLFGTATMFLLMKRAGIALGSNLGDKNSLMVQARDHCCR